MLSEFKYFSKIEDNSATWPDLTLIKCANNRLPCAKYTCQGVIIEWNKFQYKINEGKYINNRYSILYI